MTITFKDETKNNIQNLKEAYFEAARNGAEAEVVEAKYNEYMKAYTEDLSASILAEARQEVANAKLDGEIALNRGLNVLTAKERKFFTNLVEDEANYDSFKEEKILPETTVLRIFEDIKRNRPLLSKINFQVAGLRTRIIVGKPSGAAVWGEIFGKIQGQILANFTEYSFSQNKLTAFAIVPKDLLEFGPEWVERYVREQLAEAMAIKIEEGVVLGKGSGANQPYGLNQQLTKDENGAITGTADKTPVGELTFADEKTTVTELANLATKLSFDENNKPLNVLGNIAIAVHPALQFFVQAQYTILTPNGQWVTALPYQIEVVPSEFVPYGQSIAFVGNRYYAVQTGAVSIKSYDQTLALEDCDVFIAKQFAHGLPEDNNVAHVYTLNIAGMPPAPADVTTETLPGA
ncbi:phage major capsid protein [Macrococcus armenti]|uniref:phage major capsid protein n=1 Tax=Macrococcus armenti TaxID=2875764 RepID=UPI001CCDBA86|nr:phage major capsid protein [Macrococcus armenti]UBH14856.1 phage major capsid protein [Macrococcus armenti]UBH17216.1 phage major capsid protein [Macrococcus armenti]UBH19481.1 phage major capsid protein [Macrococcus armenti]